MKQQPEAIEKKDEKKFNKRRKIDEKEKPKWDQGGRGSSKDTNPQRSNWKNQK